MTSGILLVDKPTGMTSHDVVSRVRRLAGTRKVGHAGTLDPLATGLLVLGIDSATRLLTYLVGLDKRYEATIRLGQATTTDDVEGEPLGSPADTVAVSEESIRTAIEALTGGIEQVPSSVSAIKVAGRRAYDLVREGEEVALPARRVTVSRFDVMATRRADGLELDVVVECSSGTYIRALARDLGAALGVGGHLTALRRTRVGPFTVSDAGGLDECLLAGLLTPAEVATRLFPSVRVDAAEVVALTQGKRIRPAALDTALADSDAPIATLAPDGRLVGLVTTSQGTARVLVNFPSDEVVS
ncbi:tRNA pseudouridine(55) synthase TruB [Galbitalea soli]|uniref:tRNA pseudouridine synthase B n=1 Tax=Galbitalea soli TaxID=1268042 RepID=A0A7C9PLR5_9MICO|nr:tRNA pseudouridine(55) synthase TruB [Galbitalea soli]NEM90410.1 tRNA pseudouridine(55) synthase TruB [Galbitalea soli]NYJ31121.1 tRNA pseudouridine55 synthase [Galbitalea soli]